MSTVGILSIGEMGLGIAQVLKAHSFRVATNVADRSELTQSRARSADLILSPTDVDLVQECDYILSIVPPRDAITTAQRIFKAVSTIGNDWAPKKRLYYVDLNAIAPRTARQVHSIFESSPNILVVDGGIIGGVPFPKEPTTEKPINWHCPNLIVSGPHQIPDEKLKDILNVDHLGDTIGQATGLKMCFGMTTKGFTALAIQSFTTAHKLGVLPTLQQYLGKYNAATLQLAEKGLVTMPPKAYRWEHEMLEMAETVSDDGGFKKNLFEGVSEVYRTVAEDSELGQEKPGHRKRGKTVEDVVGLLDEGMRAKKARSQ